MLIDLRDFNPVVKRSEYVIRSNGAEVALINADSASEALRMARVRFPRAQTALVKIAATDTNCTD